jgi:hypothetical protein
MSIVFFQRIELATDRPVPHGDPELDQDDIGTTHPLHPRPLLLYQQHPLNPHIIEIQFQNRPQPRQNRL